MSLSFFLSALNINISANQTVTFTPAGDLNGDVILEFTYPADILNNAFQIYSDNLDNIQNINAYFLSFKISPPNTNFNSILPKTESYSVTNDHTDYAELSTITDDLGININLGVEYLSYTSNALINTKDFRDVFTEIFSYINNLHNNVDLSLKNKLSSIQQTNYVANEKDNVIHISQAIYMTIATYNPERFLDELLINHLGNNWYSNFLKKDDIIQYKVTINCDTQDNIFPRAYLFNLTLT